MLNSGEKMGIRTLKLFMDDNTYIKQVLKVIDTGSNKYTILIENGPNYTVKYSVNKRAKSGKDYGITYIERLSRHGMEYNNTLFSLPDSVVKYIKEHYVVLENYLKIGEKAFN